MAATNLQIAILDDFEKIADTVPAYAKLKARADITLVRDTVDQRTRLARAGTGQDEHGAVRTYHGGALFGIELRQVGRCCCHSVAAERVSAEGTKRTLRGGGINA
jgi:hypothetical protein